MTRNVFRLNEKDKPWTAWFQWQVPAADAALTKAGNGRWQLPAALGNFPQEAPLTAKDAGVAAM